MDKRTLIFVLSLAIALFGVNLFFEKQRTESLREWSAQQEAKKAEKLVKLQTETAARTAATSSLPLASLYTDAGLKERATSAVQSGEAYLALAWQSELPEKVYVHDRKTDKTIPLQLANRPSAKGEPVIYRPSDTAKLQIEAVRELGKYDLQLVAEEGPAPPTIYLAEYTDGKVSIPAATIAALSKEAGKEAALHPVPDALALVKKGTDYLPVGIYRAQTKEIEWLDTEPSLNELVYKQKAAPGTSVQGVEEKFYVLETPYQQLVFSNYGGALVEINLPFPSKENRESVVKEIGFDREMKKNHPYNALFPAHAFYTPSETGSKEFVKHEQGSLGGYTPLLRRDLILKDKKKSVRIPPRYYALNIVSEYPETAEQIYAVTSFTKDSIVFEGVQSHRRIIKTYSVASESEAPYTVDLTMRIEGDSRGLWLTSGVPEVELISNSSVPVLKYRITRAGKPVVETIDLPKESLTVTSSHPDWICNSNGFFGIIMDPLNETDPGYRALHVPGTAVPSRLTLIDQEFNRFNARELPGYMMMLPLKSSGGTQHLRAFAGPFSTNILKKVDAVYVNAATGYNPDYIACQSFHGWFSFISEPFAKFLFILMNLFHTLTGSWGLSIILLTVALRIMLWPLNAWSTKSMVRMQQIAPQVTAIQEKYKKDPKHAQLEIMNLYRETGVNPVSGCFPLLIQMPFLIGMFDLLKSTFELRGVGFIPGWIDDLTAPDVLFSWQQPLFFIGTQFHLLPILLGIVMFLQQRYMSTAPKDPAQMTDQQRQQRFMGNMMAVVFTIMFYNFPSGLNIYWLSSMLLGMLQQYWTTKKLKSAQPVKALSKSKK